MAAALVLLSSTTLAANGTFDVQNIDQTYSDLIGVCICRGTDTSANDYLAMRINADTGSNYDVQLLYGQAASAAAAAVQGATLLRMNEVMVAGGGTAGHFAAVEFCIFGYASTAFQKTIQIRSASPTLTTQDWTEANMGFWRSTAAVTRVQLFGNSTANLLTGSQLRLYGRS